MSMLIRVALVKQLKYACGLKFDKLANYFNIQIKYNVYIIINVILPGYSFITNKIIYYRCSC